MRENFFIERIIKENFGLEVLILEFKGKLWENNFPKILKVKSGKLLISTSVILILFSAENLLLSFFPSNSTISYYLPPNLLSPSSLGV